MHIYTAAVLWSGGALHTYRGTHPLCIAGRRPTHCCNA